MTKSHHEYWPAHLQSVFGAVGRAMGERRRLAPDVIASVSRAPGGVVAGHSVMVAYAPAGRPGGRSGVYRVTIEGPRINACWRFTAAEFERLSRSVAGAVGRRSESPDGRYELGAEVW
jgi:hypothetical protein